MRIVPMLEFYTAPPFTQQLWPRFNYIFLTKYTYYASEYMLTVLLRVSAQINHLLQSTLLAIWGLGDFCRKILPNDDKHKNAFR